MFAGILRDHSPANLHEFVAAVESVRRQRRRKVAATKEYRARASRALLAIATPPPQRDKD